MLIGNDRWLFISVNQLNPHKSAHITNPLTIIHMKYVG
jgi:hypothetical protein